MNSCIKYILSFHSPPLSSSSPPPPSPCLLLLAAWQCWKVKKLLLLENWFYDFFKLQICTQPTISTELVATVMNHHWWSTTVNVLWYFYTHKRKHFTISPKNLQVLQYFSTQVLQHLSINIVHCLRDYVRCQSGSDRSHLQRWKRYNRYSWSSKAD